MLSRSSYKSSLTVEAVDLQESVSFLAVGGPLQQTGRVRADVLRPDVEPVQSLKQAVLTHTVVALWPVVRHKPTTTTTIMRMIHTVREDTENTSGHRRGRENQKVEGLFILLLAECRT